MTPAEIASAALSLWDALADDAESPEDLIAEIAAELSDMGLPGGAANHAAWVAGRAFDAAAGRGEPVPDDLAHDPVFAAMLEELRGGAWDFGDV